MKSFRNPKPSNKKPATPAPAPPPPKAAAPKPAPKPTPPPPKPAKVDPADSVNELKHALGVWWSRSQPDGTLAGLVSRAHLLKATDEIRAWLPHDGTAGGISGARLERVRDAFKEG